MMEAACTCEMAFDIQLRTWQYIPEDSELRNYLSLRSQCCTIISPQSVGELGLEVCPVISYKPVTKLIFKLYFIQTKMRSQQFSYIASIFCYSQLFPPTPFQQRWVGKVAFINPCLWPAH
jgi:hypothetical protein